MSQLLTPKQPSRYVPAENHELVALGEMQREGVTTSIGQSFVPRDNKKSTSYECLLLSGKV